MTRAARIALLMGALFAGGTAVWLLPKSKQSAKAQHASVMARLDRRNRFGVPADRSIYHQTGFITAGTAVTGIITDSTTAWCTNVTVGAIADWDIAAGLGTLSWGADFSGANSIYIYRFASASASFWDWQAYNSGGSQIFEQISTTPHRKPSHLLSFCRATEGYTVRQDGVKVLGPTTPASFTLPSTFYVGTLGPASFGYGSNVALRDLCVSGPLAAPSGTTALTMVDAACGEFTNTSVGICYGCVTPVSGATSVLALGDSITAGTIGLGRTWPEKLNALMGTSYDISNQGVGGSTCATLRTAWTSTHKNLGYTRAVVLCGINDINAGTAATTIWNNSLKLMLDDMLASGLTVNPITVLPFHNFATWSAGKQTELEALNTSIAAWCVTNSQTCIAGYASMGDGGDATALKTSYDSGDGLHPSQVGSDALATLIRAAFP